MSTAPQRRASAIAPFVAVMLLGGFRVPGAPALRWADVGLDDLDAAVDEIVASGDVEVRRGRDETPILRRAPLRRQS